MESKVVKSDFKKLEAFLKGIRGAGDYKVRVGIMGQKNTARNYGPRSNSMTNADIGFQHEFGVPGRIPQRSFLRMPILARSNRIITEVVRVIKLRKEEVLSIELILRYLGIACERAILDAFDSKGFGNWKPNAPSTIRRKGGSSPLIDFGFLRKSISSEVVHL